MSNKKITDLSSIPSLDPAVDVLQVDDVSASTSYKVTRNGLLGITSAPLGTTDTQSPTNKTFDNTNVFTAKDTNFTLQDDGDTTKQAKFQLSGITTATTRTFTFPNATTTLVGTDATQTLTNKTLTSPTINTPTIVNPTLQTDTVAEYTSANGVTVDGLNIKDSALNTNNSVPNNAHNNTGTWGSSWAYTTWNPTLANASIGNGSVSSSYYNQVGKTVFFRFLFSLGTTSTVGTNMTFSLPVTASSNITLQHVIGTGYLQDTGTANYLANCWLASTTTALVLLLGVAGTYGNFGGLSSTTPFTWGNTDAILLQGNYEAA